MRNNTVTDPSDYNPLLKSSLKKQKKKVCNKALKLITEYDIRFTMV